MSKPTENAPKIEEVKQPVVTVAEEEAPPAAPAKTTGMIRLKDIETVRVADMLNAKSDYVSDVMMSRIEQHVAYLSGKMGFANDEARHKEQITIMETIGNSTTLSIDQYCVVTDFLLKSIRENLDSFKEGGSFRFMRGLTRVYSQRAIENYHSYMTMLVTIAGSYADRKRIFKKMDLDSITATLPKQARDNINTYMRRLCE